MNFISIKDIKSISPLVKDAISLKISPFKHKNLGKNKTLGMLFFNPSLRTRLSTQKAAVNLGMDVIVMNFSSEGWALEFIDGTIMNGSTSEHIKEAARVISQYCDIIAVRSFPNLINRDDDYSEIVIKSFVKYASVPIVSMESATGHPLQALADAITIEEFKKTLIPKIVLSWAPHPKALPQAVANSFTDIMQLQNVNFIITHPKGYELKKEITKNTKREYHQNEAFKNADFIYAKNWSSYNDYGKILSNDKNWMITESKMAITNNAKFMHCLPVRRNVIVEDAVIDSKNSIVIEQANNRTYATQAVLKKILENE